MSEPVAVYVHTPFCPSKCGYCDFNSYAMTGEIMERTTRATIAEIHRSPARGRPAKTIFFGGGTPTFLAESQLLAILEAVLTVHPPLPGAEITSEANPGTVDWPKFSAMRRAGFNRISLGAQSFVNEDLLRLGRVHQSGEIERAVGSARDAGFENLNLDLMFALPGQTRIAWRQNLARALALKPDHLSLYCLTIEPNTAYYKLHLRGALDLPDDDAQTAMYDDCVARCKEQGFQQYEISNFAKPGRECEHNLCYWRGEEYAGYGPGAVGCLAGRYWESPAERVRTTNLKHPELYCSALKDGKTATMEREPLESQTLRTERIMLGLRLNSGLPMNGLNLDPKSVDQLLGRRWIEVDADIILLTREGRHFCSEVALALI
jgi:oxygen-independent coproporphyrinogen-3 oxidase